MKKFLILLYTFTFISILSSTDLSDKLNSFQTDPIGMFNQIEKLVDDTDGTTVVTMDAAASLISYEFMLKYGFFDKANKYVNAYNTLTENSNSVYIDLEKEVRKFNNSFILIKKDYDSASDEESLMKVISSILKMIDTYKENKKFESSLSYLYKRLGYTYYKIYRLNNDLSSLALAFDNFNLSHTYNINGYIINPANSKELISLDYSHQTRVYVVEELIDKGKDEYNSGKTEEAKNKFEMAINMIPHLISLIFI